MKDLFKLMDTFEKNNQKMNFKFLSPKFGSVIQDKREDMRLFSLKLYVVILVV